TAAFGRESPTRAAACSRFSARSTRLENHTCDDEASVELEAPHHECRVVPRQGDTLARPQREASCARTARGKIQGDIVKLQPPPGHAVLAFIEGFFGAENKGGASTLLRL